MLKLMKLELRRTKLRGYLIGVAGINLFLIALLTLMSLQLDGEVALESYEMAFSLLNTFLRVAFIIFAAVLIANLIVSEYKDKSISLLFMYPISRKKLFAAKLLIVVIFTFTAMIISTVISTFVFLTIDHFIQLIPGNVTFELLKDDAIKMLFSAFSAAGISLISLYFGMRKKSTVTTIVSSFIIALFVNSNSMGYSLYDIIFIPITLALIGVGIAYMSIRNIDHVDVN
ncbi:ABC transporter permease [Paenibacillus sp. KN14-4R]|uniref:ABC transporter permease n=1 Tax=Paenibacillus sp. KN14-4R TaxID=3445773 RepID=UPI003F9F0339